MPASNSQQRFSDRVENYVRWRPGYPSELLSVLAEEAGLNQPSEVADIGSGTGISAEVFLKGGHSVYGIEPNREMREAGERLLAAYPHFRSVDGTAEQTNLPAASVDYVVAAQAFHWFDVEKTRAEFSRILRPEGWVVLLWNTRRLDSTPFLREYEALLNHYGTDYKEVQHTNIDREKLQRFFAPGTYRDRSLYNEQRFHWEGVVGRLLSSSYAPGPGHPNHEPMLKQLQQAFDQFHEHGQICFEYDTEIHLGKLLTNQDVQPL